MSEINPTTELKATTDQARLRLGLLENLEDLENWRLEILGRQGLLTSRMKGIGNLPNELRKEFGQIANQERTDLENAYENRLEELKNTPENMNDVDVSLPGRQPLRGALHPITQVRRQILDVFTRLGFATVEGPEVEADSYNFGKLRIPPDHPARDMWDTFWLDGTHLDEKILLRTHTSPMQIRYMESHPEPPIRIAVPGRCYRYEATDATHEWMLEQVELLAIDRGITLANLKGTLQEWARQMFGSERKIMMRHSYFPFVEPGVEVAIDCFDCDGSDKSCGICRGSGWLELLGAGMVHPEIIAEAGYDPNIYSGFAAGMGVERVAMVLQGVTDIRHYHDNRHSFLSQF
jgi:phenylalanyl-tRNA synthetase alpha chain|tara:strand:+ start:2379 stop:3425 length:1047 start_codon:yes stop_codon:yes gene_type:complete